MSEVKFTKGPWVAAPYSSVVGAPVVSASGRSVARVTYFSSGDAFNYYDDESKANAHLIAAAPDLYDALQKQLNNWISMVESGDAGFWDVEKDDNVIYMRAALAKARGES